MPSQQYTVQHYTVQGLLTRINEDRIAIPEIQRPFVWKSAQVRDFIDSLYRGYPVGYLIAWEAQDVRLKDGRDSIGKHILIDGQQRVTGLMAALLGRSIVDKNYKERHIRIAFHPNEDRFEVSNPAIRRNPAWISDIRGVFSDGARVRRIVDRYCEENEIAADDEKDAIDDRLERLLSIKHNMLGLIQLNSDLELEKVSEIFIRVNSKGVPLTSADFALSRMSANEDDGGHLIRKSIDYFCHLARRPES